MYKTVLCLRRRWQSIGKNRGRHRPLRQTRPDIRAYSAMRMRTRTTIRGRLYDRIIQCWSTRVNDKIKPEKENERYVKKRRKINCKQKPKLIHYYKAHNIWHRTPLRTRCLCVYPNAHYSTQYSAVCSCRTRRWKTKKQNTHNKRVCFLPHRNCNAVATTAVIDRGWRQPSRYDGQGALDQWPACLWRHKSCWRILIALSMIVSGTID